MANLLNAFKTVNLGDVQQHRDTRSRNALVDGVMRYQQSQQERQDKAKNALSQTMANGGSRQDQQRAAFDVSPEMGMKMGQYLDGLDDQKRNRMQTTAKFISRFGDKVTPQNYGMMRDAIELAGGDIKDMPDQFDPNAWQAAMEYSRMVSDHLAKPLTKDDLVKIDGGDGAGMYVLPEQAYGQMPYEKPEHRDRKTAKDANGILRYLDSGERAFPGVKKGPETLDIDKIIGTEFKFGDKFRGDAKEDLQRIDAYRNLEAIWDDPSEAAQGAQVVTIDGKRFEMSGQGAADIGLIFGFMKMHDPTSVVREGEYETAANTSGKPQWVLNLLNKTLNGDKLSGTERAALMRQARNQYNAAIKSANGKLNSIREQAGQYKGWGIDADRALSFYNPYEARIPAEALAFENGNPQVVKLPENPDPAMLKKGQVYQSASGQLAVWDGDSFEPVE